MRQETATLTYPLPEFRTELIQAVNVGKLLSFIWDWENDVLRAKTKYGDGKPVSWEEVREEYHKLKSEAGLPEEMFE